MPTPAVSRRRLLAALPLGAAATVLPGAAGVAGATEGPPAPPPIVPFAEWAPRWTRRPTGADVAATQRFVVHHTSNPVARTPDEVRGALADICAMHTSRGFDAIGYHYVVDPWGGIWQARGRLPGEGGAAPTAQPEGAHVAGSNPGAVGVVFLGDHELAPPTLAALDAATRLLGWLVTGPGLDPDQRVAFHADGAGTGFGPGWFEAVAIDGHRASNATLCPGRHLAALLPQLRTAVRAVSTGADTDPWGIRQPEAPTGPAGTLTAGGSIRPADATGTTHVASPGSILPAPAVPGSTGARLALDVAAVGAAALLRRRWLADGVSFTD